MSLEIIFPQIIGALFLAGSLFLLYKHKIDLNKIANPDNPDLEAEIKNLFKVKVGTPALALFVLGWSLIIIPMVISSMHDKYIKKFLKENPEFISTYIKENTDFFRKNLKEYLQIFLDDYQVKGKVQIIQKKGNKEEKLNNIEDFDILVYKTYPPSLPILPNGEFHPDFKVQFSKHGFPTLFFESSIPGVLPSEGIDLNDKQIAEINEETKIIKIKKPIIIYYTEEWNE